MVFKGTGDLLRYGSYTKVLNLSAFGGFIVFSSIQIMINLDQDCLSVFGGFTAQSSTQLLIN